MIRLLGEAEKETVYPELFREIFGFGNFREIPRIVIVQDDDGVLKGFCSGYLIDKDTFYMAWGGVTGNFTGSRKVYASIYQFIKQKLGASWLQTNVENTNTVWQRVLMGIGHIPHGVKATNGKIYIEYYKEL